MRALVTIAAVLALTLNLEALAQPASGTAEESSGASEGWRSVADRRLESIREERARNGPHSEALIDHYMALGLLYQEQDAHALAVENLEQALQVKRVNDGLYTLEQVPLLRQLSASQAARGNDDAARKHDSEIVRLTRLNANDLRIVPILHEMGDKQLEGYGRYVEGEVLAPHVGLDLSLFGGGVDRRIGSGSGAQSPLRQASNHYSNAIGVLLRHGLYEHEDLPELERKLLRTYYYRATSEERRPGAQGLYHLGERSLERLILYRARESEDPVAVAKGLVELADWRLLFSRNGQALDGYKAAYAMLVEIGADEATLEELFSPSVPVVLPAFIDNPLKTERPGVSTEHVDVEFELGRFGTSRRIEIVDASPSASEETRKGLTRMINRSRFRPRLLDAESVDDSPLLVRYHVSQ